MLKETGSVSFHFRRNATLNNRIYLKKFILEKIWVAMPSSGVEINYVFCSDEELLEINREHLNHNYYTDIITFDLSEKGTGALVSDIYISVDRVRDNAVDHKVSFRSELHRVIFHGILHLLGHRDKSEREEEEMREMEDIWMQQYFSQLPTKKK